MAESQSRYSIVADLTSTKLEIIGAKANLDGDVKISKQRVEELKEELKDWESSIKDDTARIKRERERAIKSAERDAKNSEEKKKSKEISFDLKLRAIDEALDKIKAISDASAKEASQ